MAACNTRKASICHAVVAVFLQFFSWGLITAPMIHILNTTFKEQALLMNGVVMGVKGFLSFLSAPLIGALSDVFGRKMFLLITALFTCLPVPFLKVDPTLYFVALTLSGIFSIIFSVAFAYISDVTDESSRSLGYGAVTAGFAASLIISPAMGAGIEMVTGSETIVVIVATLIAAADVVFILFFVPESLTNNCKLKFKTLTFKQVDPFTSLGKIWKDKTVLVISLVTFLSYLPEAGQSTCFFVYLTLVLGFSKMNVAIFICYVGLVSAISQTVVLSKMIERIGPKYSIMVGLVSQLVQLVCYGVTTNMVAVWVSGLAVALSSITYAAVSAYASLITDKDKQGAVQGTLMGVRGLCNGLGPAAFGLMWHFFGINIIGTEVGLQGTQQDNITEIYLGGNYSDTKTSPQQTEDIFNVTEIYHIPAEQSESLLNMPGLPFLISSFSVILALILSVCLKSINIDESALERNQDNCSSNSDTAVNLCDDEKDRNDNHTNDNSSSPISIKPEQML